MEVIYQKASLRSSRVITNYYSTSFSLGIRVLSKEMHDAIYAIYGFVRLADEIVDTFHDHDKELLLAEFVKETDLAVKRQLSLNPILHSFQWVVNTYNIEAELYDSFIKSMRFDLHKKEYTKEEIKEYIYGSAEVVGLMCLRVFCDGDEASYQALKEPAKRLGSAFQKINFLRDLKDDFTNKGRSYFPNVDLSDFTEEDKELIEQDILEDFLAGFEGIKSLPKCSKLGVYTAYTYYLSLFRKIKSVEASRVLQERIRISNLKKYLLIIRAYFQFKFGKI